MYKEITCPYCEYEYDLCHDDGAFYKQDGVEEEECPECGQKFLVKSDVEWTFETVKADCLNTKEHKWKKKYNPKFYPELSNKEICEDCYYVERTVEN